MDHETTLQDLKTAVKNFIADRNWKSFHNPKNVAMSIAIEAAEIMEHFQWKSDEEISAYLKDKKNSVSDELADVFYWVLLIANDLDIDIDSALRNKIKKNEAKYPVKKAKGKHSKYTEL